MEIKTLYLFVGNNVNNTDLIKENVKDEFCLIDNKIFNGQIFNKENFISVHFDEYEKLEVTLDKIDKVENIIVCPLISYNDNFNEFLMDIEYLLKKLIIVSKGIYSLALISKGIKVWFIDLIGCYVNINQNDELIESISAGISSIAKVLGMELSRKKTTSNYIKLNDKKKLDSLSEFIQWTKERALYLDMQNIIV